MEIEKKNIQKTYLERISFENWKLRLLLSNKKTKNNNQANKDKLNETNGLLTWKLSNSIPNAASET